MFILLLTLFYLIRYLLFLLGSSGNYSIRFLDVGQGDAIFITTSNNKKILIDGGDSFTVDSYVTEWLPTQCYIDIIIATHPHSDHILGLNRVLERCEVGTVFFNEVEYESEIYEHFKSLAYKNDSMPLTYPKYVEIDGLKMYVLWPTVSYIRGDIHDINDASIVLLMDYEGFEAVFTGDVSKDVMGRIDMTIAEEIVQGSVDVYKVAHHGSNTSLGVKFILGVSPKVSVISVGADNKFGHPNSEVIKFLESIGSSVYRTDIDGAVDIVF